MFKAYICLKTYVSNSRPWKSQSRDTIIVKRLESQRIKTSLGTRATGNNRCLSEIDLHCNKIHYVSNVWLRESNMEQEHMMWVWHLDYKFSYIKVLWTHQKPIESFYKKGKYIIAQVWRTGKQNTTMIKNMKYSQTCLKWDLSITNHCL